MGEYQHIYHEFEPVFDEQSEILILGSLPSVKSRENHFYYGHPQNRFWKVLAGILECDIPDTIEDKKAMLLSHHIALWDVIAECDIIGSSDSSIRNVVVNDIQSIVQRTKIQKIYANGATAGKLYKKYALPKVGMECIQLPSTSPANAAFSVERLCQKWIMIREE